MYPYEYTDRQSNCHLSPECRVTLVKAVAFLVAAALSLLTCYAVAKWCAASSTNWLLRAVGIGGSEFGPTQEARNRR